MSLSTEQRSTFLRFYDDFVASFLETPEGRAQLALYERSVREGRQNYKNVIERLDQGEEITDTVLLKLLPHRNTLGNVKRGAWIHITPAVQGDLRQWFERQGWINKKNWFRVARDIIRFLHNCIDDPANLEFHCNEFESIPYIKGLQCGYLTPILEALKPKTFTIVNPRSVKTLSYFTGEKFTTNVARYPQVNERITGLLQEVGDELVLRSGLKRFPAARLFNLFSWWGIEKGIFKDAVLRYRMPKASNDLLLKEPSVGSDQSRKESQRGIEKKSKGESGSEIAREGQHQQVSEPLTIDQTAALLHMPVERLQRWASILRDKKQMILYGPPGTGKTYIAEHLARHLTAGTEGLQEMVQFHPSYSYEDFIQGIRPQRSEEGTLDYPVIEGRFLRFCREARMRGDAPSVLVIDEINRANLSKVFGELMYLLEYRDRNVRLANDGKLFAIPENVYLIGTMNTADRSIALVDYALRRRFAFIELEPDYDLLRRYYAEGTGSAEGVDLEGLIPLLRTVNSAIEDRHYRIGISFFLRVDLRSALRDVWQTEIEPYLEEYFFDDTGKVEEFRWERIAERVLR